MQPHRLAINFAVDFHYMCTNLYIHTIYVYTHMHTHISTQTHTHARTYI